MALLLLCLESSFLFRILESVAPFLRAPSGCCRNTRSLCDWLMPGSFCCCRRRKNSFAPFLKIPPAGGSTGAGQVDCGGNAGPLIQDENEQGHLSGSSQSGF